MGLLWIYAENGVDNTDFFLQLQSSACTASWPFLVFILPHYQESCGCTKMREEVQLGQVTPTDQRDTQCHMASCSACKASGRRRKRGCSELWNLSPLVTVVCDWALMNTCLPMRRSELFCFVCVTFVFLLKLLYLKPLISHFFLSILSPIPSVVQWAAGCVMLAGVKPWHSV